MNAKSNDTAGRVRRMRRPKRVSDSRVHTARLCSPRQRVGARMFASIEIEVAQRFFDRSILGLFEAFGKFARQHIFFRSLRFDGRPEF